MAKLAAALPLLALDIDDSPLSAAQRDIAHAHPMHAWSLANRWLFTHNDADRLFFFAHIPMVAMGATLGLLLFVWTRELFGSISALAALTSFVFDANFLAHSAIVHTDVPFALMVFASCYFFWRTLKDVNWANWGLAALSFALAAITKFSFVALLPIWAAMALCRVIDTTPLEGRVLGEHKVASRVLKFGWISAIIISVLVCTYVVIWAAYGFRYDAFSEQRMALRISSAIEPAFWLKPVVPIFTTHELLPEAWLYGLVYALSSFNRTAYLLGEISGFGFFWFFPLAILVKTPFPTLISLALVAYCLFLDRDFGRRTIFIWLPPVIFLGLAIYSHMNIGLRHILPIYPFMFLLCGAALSRLWESGVKLLRIAVLVLGCWTVVSCFATYPNYLGFFNEAIASESRHKYLVDSNLDWGQDLKGLKKWMDSNGVKKIRLAYFGTADPAFYGIDWVHSTGTLSEILGKPSADAGAAAPPYIAISLTHLVGVYLGPTNFYKPFLDKTPIAKIGDSIWVFRTDR